MINLKNKIKQKGFTLLDITLTMGIATTLAFLAVPSYNDFTIKAQVTKGLSQANGALIEVQEYIAVNGDMPSFSAELNNTEYVSSIEVVNGEIQVAFNGSKAHKQLRDVVLTYSPTVNSQGNIEWGCALSDSTQYAPSNCKDKIADTNFDFSENVIFPEMSDKDFGHYELGNYNVAYNFGTLPLTIYDKNGKEAGYRNFSYTVNDDNIEILTDSEFKNNTNNEFLTFNKVEELEKLMRKIGEDNNYKQIVCEQVNSRVCA